MYYDIIVLGVVVSILFSELTRLSPAGLVVPGYFVLSLHSPMRAAYTLLIAFLALGAEKLLGRVMILYGRRSFAALILLSFLIDGAIQASGIWAGNPGMIGCLVAGILARELERQGIVRSLGALGVVTGILSLLLRAMGHPVFGTQGVWR